MKRAWFYSRQDDFKYQQSVLLQFENEEITIMLQNTNILVSFIIPVYNVDTYIARCLQSIQERSYTNFEAILVDDCSTDDSYSICQEFAAKDKRFKVIQMPQNSGAGNARQKGIQIAQGDFIGFVDSDDWLGRNFITHLLLLQQETDADIVSCQALHCKQDGDIFVNFPINLKKTYSPQNALILLEQESILYPVLWDKLYKREIVLSTKIRTQSCEDGYALIDYIRKANKVAFTGLPLYHYNKSENTLSGSVSRIDHFKFYCHLAQILRSDYGYKSSRIVKTGLNHLHAACCFRYNRKIRAYIIHQLITLIGGLQDMQPSLKEKFQRFIALRYPTAYATYYKNYLRIFHKKTYQNNSYAVCNEYRILLKEIIQKINQNDARNYETFDCHNLFE